MISQPMLRTTKIIILPLHKNSFTMKTRTEISVLRSENLISTGQSVVAVGSCFAEVVAHKLADRWVDVESNPLGEMFNPLSIADCIERLAEGREFVQEELGCRGDLWFAYDTADLMAQTSAERALGVANQAVRRGGEALRKADWVVLTLGTAWVYERAGRVVANCHKMPQSEFVRRLLSVDEICQRLVALLNGPLGDKNVVLTISPVRHLADGLEGNSLSKALLRVAVDRVVAECANAHYFAAYEIMLDDLRDYRYYGADMAHPSELAEEYVWERFAEAFVADEVLAEGEPYRRLLAMAAHRPLHPQSEAYRAHCATVRERARQLLAVKPTPRLEKLAHFGLEE